MGEEAQPLGPAEIHDAVVETVLRREERLLVGLRPYGTQTEGLAIEFTGVSEVEETDAVGMRLYSLVELRSVGGQRRFEFVNSDEEGRGRLVVSASEMSWETVG